MSDVEVPAGTAPAATEPVEERRSSRKRQPSHRLQEAEDHAAAVVAPEPVEVKAKKPRKSPAPKPAPKKSPAPKAATKAAPRAAPARSPARAAAKKAVPVKPKAHILVILVHVDRLGNSTEFWTAAKSKITKAQLHKLAACHHGALNDDEDQYMDINEMLKEHFEKKDDIFFEKPDIQPVKINQHISEVYQMHFGDFSSNQEAPPSYEGEQYGDSMY